MRGRGLNPLVNCSYAVGSATSLPSAASRLVQDGAALNVIEAQVFVVPTRPMLGSDLPAISGGQLSRGLASGMTPGGEI